MTQKEIAVAVNSMTQTTGWELLQAELEAERKNWHTKLLNAPDGTAEEREAKYSEKTLRWLLERVEFYQNKARG